MPVTWSIGKDFVEEHKRIFLRTILDIPLTCIPPTWCFWTKMVEIYVFHFSAENHLIEKSVRKLKNRSKCCSYFCCSNANLCWSSLSILFNNRLCGVAWPGDKKVDIPLYFTSARQLNCNQPPLSHPPTLHLRPLNCRTHIAQKQPTLVLLPPPIGWFLFQWISEYPILHVPMLIPLLHWFQNSFCFRSRTFPSHGGNFFDYNGNYSGKTAKKRFLAIKSVTKVLQPSS